MQGFCALIVHLMGVGAPEILGALRYVGAAYVAWLAVHIARSTPDLSGAASRASFSQGFLLQFVNAKIYLFGITALTGFVVGLSCELPVLMASKMLIAAIGTIATLTWIAFGVLLQDAYRAHYRAANAAFAAASPCAPSRCSSETRSGRWSSSSVYCRYRQ